MKHITSINPNQWGWRASCSCGWVGGGGDKTDDEARLNAFSHLGASAQTEHREDYVPPMLTNSQREKIHEALGIDLPEGTR